MEYHNNENQETQFIPFTVQICRNIISLSNQSLIHVVNLDPGFATSSLIIRALHLNSISTILIDGYRYLTKTCANLRSKNLIFLLNDVSEILSLILSTTFSSNGVNEVTKYHPITDGFNNFTENDFTRKGKPPEFCVQLDGKFLGKWTHGEKNCETWLKITSKELLEGSELTDHVFDYTRGLSLHKIWNFNNYIIFMVTSANATPRSLQNVNATSKGNTFTTIGDIHHDLTFLFKFFWRFFKGHRILICLRVKCYNYKPYEESLVWYENTTTKIPLKLETNMRGKRVRYYMSYRQLYKVENVLPWGVWGWIFHEALQELSKSYNYTPIGVFDFPIASDKADDHELSLKYDIDVYSLDVGLNLDGMDLDLYDLTTSIDTYSLCFATPAAGYKPQYLVAFQSFSSPVWTAVILTVITFLAMQFAFQRSQVYVFHQLYSEEEVSKWEKSSVILTVYAYFICGSPYSVLLGRHCTGRILFVIFAFSALILSTVFLNGMTTFLMERVHYANIETVSELEASDLLIQSQDLDMHRKYFDQVGYEQLEYKLIDNFKYYKRTLLEAVEENEAFQRVFFLSQIKDAFNATINKYGETEADKLNMERMSPILGAVRQTFVTDAFLLNIPSSAVSEGNILTTSVMVKERYEYHPTRECLMTYPLAFPVLRSTWLFNALNERIALMFETGQVDGIQQETEIKTGVSIVAEAGEESPRSFSLSDVLFSFICLIVGLWISYFVFVAELLIDLMK
ncbi:unnamed protein product [Bemisia tabaci]|uniref:Ionotropic receptor n=1 Tax=Bemisia tabaci TaxID=7038 RepID=A0A9P0AHK1_BEMTA|nr:unnamed protein product [Bemisia tabaci]